MWTPQTQRRELKHTSNRSLARTRLQPSKLVTIKLLSIRLSAAFSLMLFQSNILSTTPCRQMQMGQIRQALRTCSCKLWVCVSPIVRLGNLQGLEDVDVYLKPHGNKKEPGDDVELKATDSVISMLKTLGITHHHPTALEVAGESGGPWGAVGGQHGADAKWVDMLRETDFTGFSLRTRMDEEEMLSKVVHHFADDE